MINKCLGHSLFSRRLDRYTNYSEHELLIRGIMRFVGTNKIIGDYLEFGVYRGRGFISAYKWAEINKLNDMKFYAFDSFEGLPKLEKEDDLGVFQEGEFKASRKEFESNLIKARVDKSKVEIIEGFYNKSLNSNVLKRLSHAAVINIDCDIYSSTKTVLDFITHCSKMEQ